VAGVLRIAMWSGPRTLSTALMRSFASRPDTAVIDEPLYGYYLARTGLDHPGRDEVIASMPTDWREAVRRLTTEPVPDGKRVFYQKHMIHHVLDEVDLDAFAGLRAGQLKHAHLIRDPRLLLASYARVRKTPTLADLGLERQVALFRRFGGPVIDAADLAARPQQVLEALCAALGLAFDETMLHWPAGPQPYDGVWGRYWYASVWKTTGFEAPGPAAADRRLPQAPLPPLPPHLEPLATQCQPFYDELNAHALR
jgi:hypothetical protein